MYPQTFHPCGVRRAAEKAERKHGIHQADGAFPAQEMIARIEKSGARGLPAVRQDDSAAVYQLCAAVAAAQRVEKAEHDEQKDQARGEHGTHGRFGNKISARRIVIEIKEGIHAQKQAPERKGIQIEEQDGEDIFFDRSRPHGDEAQERPEQIAHGECPARRKVEKGKDDGKHRAAHRGKAEPQPAHGQTDGLLREIQERPVQHEIFRQRVFDVDFQPIPPLFKAKVYRPRAKEN